MPATVITSSPNIASLDSKLVGDLCAGLFYMDLTPTIYIGSGENNVLGAKFKITNPFGVVVRPYPVNYDITPAFSGGMQVVTSFSVPTQANNYQYGVYIIDAQLTDADGTNYYVSKSLSICAPNPLDVTKNYGTLLAKLSGVCNQGKVYVKVDNEPAYKGFIASSAVRNFNLYYPTGSALPVLNTVQPSFSVQLFEGVYKISGTSCALYSYGDNVFAKVNYQVNYSKPISCSLDEACVFSGLAALNQKMLSDCSDAEKQDTSNRIEKSGLLLNSIYFGIAAGEDVSDYISQLQDVLGVNCGCNFNNGTPIINNNPASDILIQGCNVSSEVSGLTTVYTIENYSYTTTITDNGGALTISDPTLDSCVQSQVLTFNIAIVYSQIRNIANSTLDENNFWASIIKKSLNSMDASCLGLTTDQLTALTFEQLIQLMINKSCAGGSCSATIDTILATQQGGNVLLSWTETNAFSIEIFVDNIFVATVLSASTSYVLTGYSDGNTHTYSILSKCSNGVYGTALQGTFAFAGCATIAPPTVSSNNITNASCPYDLTGLVASLPVGISAEWHTANNTLPSTLVPDETQVSDGVFYVFATDSNGCYSTSVRVTVTCAISSSCTAPQNLTITAIIGGLKVSFQTPTYPPPGNSFTVKRKAASDPDIDGSYTTIGAPTFNVSTNRWEITDTTAVNNTLYTYKAISNCGMTTPSIMTNFANINCPSLTLTSDDTTSIDYSFSDTGGEINKYQVEIWSNDGLTLIHTDTILPSLVFPTPITGTFSYLTPSTNYKIRIVPFIGTNSFPCSFSNKFTGSPLSVVANKTGTFSGTLSADVIGGVAPYTYLWTCIASGGACEAHTISNPTSVSTAYTCTAYSGVTYQFHVIVHDSLSNSASADATPVLPCLIPETLITMKDGSEQQLGTLNVGDELFGNDNKVEKVEEFTVNKLYVINEGLLSASEGHIHILFGIDEELVQSLSLKVGDYLTDKNNEPIEIEDIVVKEGEFKVINITTSTKTYIANSILTHNKLACP